MNEIKLPNTLWKNFWIIKTADVIKLWKKFWMIIVAYIMYGMFWMIIDVCIVCEKNLDWLNRKKSLDKMIKSIYLLKETNP